MIRSANGWSANDRSYIGRYTLPGGEVALRKGDVSVVLLWCAHRWHETVEPLVWPGVWGYAERLIRGSSTTLSNHSSGTALDLNAPQHPLGTDPETNFSPDEIAAIRAILEFCEDTVRWGGDYSGRKDGMHLEVIAGLTDVRRVADKIRAGASGSTEGLFMALTDAEQREILDGIRRLKPGVVLPARSANCRAEGDDAFGSTLHAWAEAADARAAIERLATQLAHATGPATLSDIDVSRIANAVIGRLAAKVTAPDPNFPSPSPK